MRVLRNALYETGNMIFVYGECRQIMREAVRLYAERFPDCVHPSFSVFSNIVQTFQGTGNVNNKNANESRKQLSKFNEHFSCSTKTTSV